MTMEGVRALKVLDRCGQKTKIPFVSHIPQIIPLLGVYSPTFMSVTVLTCDEQEHIQLGQDTTI